MRNAHNESQIQQFPQYPIHVHAKCMTAKYQKYIQKTNQRKNQIREKYKVQNILTRIATKWRSRKLENDAKKLQEEAVNNNYDIIWKYRKALLNINKMDKNYTLTKNDGTHTTTPEERQKRWTERIETCFQSKPEKENLTLRTYQNKHEKCYKTPILITRRGR